MPDARVPLTARGWQQAICAGDRLRAEMDALEGGRPYKLFFYTSPYLRSRQVGWSQLCRGLHAGLPPVRGPLLSLRRVLAPTALHGPCPSSRAPRADVRGAGAGI